MLLPSFFFIAWLLLQTSGVYVSIGIGNGEEQYYDVLDRSKKNVVLRQVFQAKCYHDLINFHIYF